MDYFLLYDQYRVCISTPDQHYSFVGVRLFFVGLNILVTSKTRFIPLSILSQFIIKFIENKKGKRTKETPVRTRSKFK